MAKRTRWTAEYMTIREAILDRLARLDAKYRQITGLAAADLRGGDPRRLASPGRHLPSGEHRRAIRAGKRPKPTLSQAHMRPGARSSTTDWIEQQPWFGRRKKK